MDTDDHSYADLTSEIYLNRCKAIPNITAFTFVYLITYTIM